MAPFSLTAGRLAPVAPWSGALGRCTQGGRVGPSILGWDQASIEAGQARDGDRASIMEAQINNVIL